MRLTPLWRSGVLIAGLCAGVLGQGGPGGDTQPEVKGLPPRVTPAEYQARVQAGTVTIAAEFKGHYVSTLEGTLTTEEYVVVEVGVYGPTGARLRLSAGDFWLRINGRKETLPAQQYGRLVASGSLKDPEWEPPESSKSKSKTGINTGGEASNEPPAPVKIPIPVQRAMAQRVQRAALPEGDRTLPQAGLLFFEYRGRAQGIRTVELTYDGPAGKATLDLRP